MRHEKKEHEKCQKCAVEYLSSDRKHHQRNCSVPSNRIPTCSIPFDKTGLAKPNDSSVEDFTGKYHHRAISALEEFKAIVYDIYSAAEEGTREREDYEEYYNNVLNGATAGKPVTAEQYLDQYSGSAYSHPTDHFVICSWEEARTVLERGPLKLPILIPKDLNHSFGDKLHLEEYLKYLKTRRQLDVHIYRKPADEGRIPKRLDSDSAVELFLKESNGPVNLLGLDGYQPNPVHPSISGLNYFFDLSAIDLGASGSRQGLKKTAAFQLLGSMGAISTPHTDLYGVLTIFTNEEGNKLWPLWPGWRLKDHYEYCSVGKYASAAVVLLLGEGDTGLMPAGLLHAPGTKERTLMTGTMHHDCRNILQQLALTLLQLWFPHLTNEPVAPDFIPKMRRVLDLWENGEGNWIWPDKDHLEMARDVLERVQKKVNETALPKKRRRRKRLQEPDDADYRELEETILVIDTTLFGVKSRYLHNPCLLTCSPAPTK